MRVLQCLHESKLLVRYAETHQWDDFSELLPSWQRDVDEVLAHLDEAVHETPAVENTLTELLKDIDLIRRAIKQQMFDVEEEMSDIRQQQKAVKSYLA